MSAPISDEIKTFFQESRSSLALALVESSRLVPRFNDLVAREGDLNAFAERELACLIDYAAGWIGGDNKAFRALYVGERAKMAYMPGDSAAERNLRLKTLIEKDQAVFDQHIKALSPDAYKKIITCFEDLARPFGTAFSKELKVLFVGDCVHLDIVAFLTGLVADADVGLAPHFVTDKNPALVASKLKKLGSETFDLIFYSPFTYEYSASFMRTLDWRNALMGKKAKDALLEEMMADVTLVGRTLATTFSAPTFIHNAAVVIRAETASNVEIKHAITGPLRRFFRKAINDRLEKLLRDLNEETFPHLHKVDETKFLNTMSESALGEYFYYAPLQHPARLGERLANDYGLIIETVAHLFKKKMIVCDLDNTLWDGVIGDGPVDHFADRQNLLKKLKNKGILLSIASKNDPRNVHWKGGVLGEQDFVFSHISWAPKLGAFPKMQESLNLKMKDFVFVDDRADERAMVEENFPLVKAFDATANRTWEKYALWERLLEENPDMDRTQMYHDRAKREAFKADPDDAIADEAAMFGSLDLKIKIWEATKSDIPRATELINRTNQFNMCDSRTTFAEMTAWREGDAHRIYLASMADRFGDMGVISVIVADYTGDIVNVPIFVLSCRVFGYGAEKAILNRLKRNLESANKSGIKGVYTPTMVNMPCKDVYQENDFVESDDVWTYHKGTSVIEDPSWLSVEIDGKENH